MKHAACCYVQKLDGSGRVLGVFNPKYSAWALPGGKVEPNEPLDRTAERELCEETGIVARAGICLYSSEGSADPQFMVHVFQVRIGQRVEPRTCEPGNTVAWITPAQLCESEAFGPFYQKFFRSRNWRPRG